MFKINWPSLRSHNVKMHNTLSWKALFCNWTQNTLADFDDFSSCLDCTLSIAFTKGWSQKTCRFRDIFQNGGEGFGQTSIEFFYLGTIHIHIWGSQVFLSLNLKKKLGLHPLIFGRLFIYTRVKAASRLHFLLADTVLISVRNVEADIG